MSKGRKAPQSGQPNISPNRGDSSCISSTHLLFERIDDFLQMRREHFPLRYRRSGVEDFVLVC